MLRADHPVLEVMRGELPRQLDKQDRLYAEGTARTNDPGQFGILTDTPPVETDVDLHACRHWIEQGFRGLKRGGWQWHRTRRRDSVRVARQPRAGRSPPSPERTSVRQLALPRGRAPAAEPPVRTGPDGRSRTREPGPTGKPAPCRSRQRAFHRPRSDPAGPEHTLNSHRKYPCQEGRREVLQSRESSVS